MEDIFFIECYLFIFILLFGSRLVFGIIILCSHLACNNSYFFLMTLYGYAYLRVLSRMNNNLQIEPRDLFS